MCLVHNWLLAFFVRVMLVSLSLYNIHALIDPATLNLFRNLYIHTLSFVVCSCNIEARDHPDI